MHRRHTLHGLGKREIKGSKACENSEVSFQGVKKESPEKESKRGWEKEELTRCNTVNKFLISNEQKTRATYMYM